MKQRNPSGFLYHKIDIDVIMTARENEQKKLKALDRQRKTNSGVKNVEEVFNLGIDAFNNGITEECLFEDNKNDPTFMNGYNHAKRLAYIQELEQQKHKR